MRPVLKRLNEERIGDAKNHVRPADKQVSQERQVSPGEVRQTSESGQTGESRWAQTDRWVQVSSGVFKSVSLCSGVFRWGQDRQVRSNRQMSPGELRSVQVCSGMLRYVQVCSGKSRCVQVCSGMFRWVSLCSGACYSRGLGPGGVLSELTVMDGEIWTKVAAELQRTDAAERGHSVTIATTLLSDWLLQWLAITWQLLTDYKLECNDNNWINKNSWLKQSCDPPDCWLSSDQWVSENLNLLCEVWSLWDSFRITADEIILKILV